jgi:hypothetical protein
MDYAIPSPDPRLPRTLPVPWGNYWHRGDDPLHCPGNDKEEQEKSLSDKEIFDKILREYMTI